MTEDVRTVLGMMPKDAQRDEPLKGPISQGPATNTGGHENRVTPTVGAGREVMRHAGENAGSAGNTFEGRVTQGGSAH
jgi:hypothetical protein